MTAQQSVRRVQPYVAAGGCTVAAAGAAARSFSLLLRMLLLLLFDWRVSALLSLQHELAGRQVTSCRRRVGRTLTVGLSCYAAHAATPSPSWPLSLSAFSQSFLSAEAAGLANSVIIQRK